MKKYQVIYADPPWEYRHKVTGRGGRGAASHHYHTMTLDEIKNLPIKHLADDNCFLWMWITNPVMAEGWHIEILKEWGFKPQTVLTWVNVAKKKKWSVNTLINSILEESVKKSKKSFTISK